MDATTERLVDFAHQPGFSALSADTVDACKLRLIDTMACALGAYDEPLAAFDPDGRRSSTPA